jgi:hypothetical protein
LDFGGHSAGRLRGKFARVEMKFSNVHGGLQIFKWRSPGKARVSHRFYSENPCALDCERFRVSPLTMVVN